MKLLFLTNLKSPHFERWINYFIVKGFQVAIITIEYGNYSNNFLEGCPIYKLPYFRTVNKKIDFILNTLILPIILFKIIILYKKISPNITHAHQIYPMGFWGALLNIKPLIITPMGSDILVFSKKYKLYHYITKFSLNRARLITGDSLLIGREVKNYTSCEYLLIQNGVDQEHFNTIYKNESRTEIEENYQISNDEYIILHARGFGEIYRIPIIIKTIKELKIKGYKIKLLLLGHSGDLVLVKDLIKSYNLEKDIIIAGFVEHRKISKFYKASDFFVSIPISDSSPASVYEAMSCFCVPIIGKLPWTEYAMKNMENCIIVENINEFSLSEAIQFLIENNSILTTLKNNGSQTVEKYFCYHKNMEILLHKVIQVIK